MTSQQEKHNNLYGYGWRQAANASVNAYAQGGIKSPLPILDASIGVKGEGGVSAENNSNQTLEKENSTRNEDSVNHNLNTLMRAASNEHYTKDDSIDQSLAQSTRASYDKMQSYGQSISQRKEEVENYNQALQASESRGGTDRRDMYHELEQNVAKEYGVSQDAAHQMIETNDKRANKVWDAMVEREIEQELAQVKSDRTHIENKPTQEGVSFANEHSVKVTNQGQLAVQKQAESEGLDADVMRARINKNYHKISDTQESMGENANNQIHSIKHNNKVLEQGMNKKIDQYEKDRIGQGKTSKVVGLLAQVPTLGNAGDINVGGMNSIKKAQEYLKEKK